MFPSRYRVIPLILIGLFYWKPNKSAVKLDATACHALEKFGAASAKMAGLGASKDEMLRFLSREVPTTSKLEQRLRRQIVNYVFTTKFDIESTRDEVYQKCMDGDFDS